MESDSARLEREVEEARWQFSRTLNELRCRMPTGVDEVIDYARDSAAASFVRKLRQEVLENPMPLVVMVIGIVWLMVASSRTPRVAIIANAADAVAGTPEKIGTATSAAISRTSEWEQQTAA